MFKVSLNKTDVKSLHIPRLSDNKLNDCVVNSLFTNKQNLSVSLLHTLLKINLRSMLPTQPVVQSFTLAPLIKLNFHVLLCRAADLGDTVQGRTCLCRRTRGAEGRAGRWTGGRMLPACCLLFTLFL